LVFPPPQVFSFSSSRTSCLRDRRERQLSPTRISILVTAIDGCVVFDPSSTSHYFSQEDYPEESANLTTHQDDANEDDAVKEIENTTSILASLDPGLGVADLFAIILASQLIGLLDIVNNPEFIKQGGWMQPIPTVPSTLGTLLQRISSLAVSWIFSVFLTISMATTSIAASMTGKKMKGGEQDGASRQWEYPTETFLIFCVFRVAQGFISMIEPNDLFVTFRDCYVVGLVTLTMRYFYRQYFI
jgi:hypothetical protein